MLVEARLGTKSLQQKYDKILRIKYKLVAQSYIDIYRLH